MSVKVFWIREICCGDVECRNRDRCGEEGVASVCWVFLEPARCVKMDGHLIAAERSS